MIRLIALDLDGTLLMDDHKTVSRENREALRFAAEQGVKIVLASGRTFVMMRDIIEQIDALDYVLVSNGAAVLDPTSGAPVYHGGELEPEQAARLFQVLRSYPVSYRVYCGGQVYWDKQGARRALSSRQSRMFFKNSMKKMLLVEDVADTLGGRTIEKIHVSDIEESCREEFRADLEHLGGLEFTSSIPGTVEINREGVSKGATLAAFCGSLAIAAGDVMAFGDSDNDETMLRWAGWSFAMGNAGEQARGAARYVTAANHEHGVAREIYRRIGKNAETE